MITTLLFDFCRVLIFPKDTSYQGKLNALHFQLSQREGYSFLDYFVFNEELLDFVIDRQNQFGFYIFTSGSIQELPDVRNRIGHLFRGVFSVKNIGYIKGDPQAYRSIAKEIERGAGEILFIDDSFGNVKVAKQAGMNAIVFENNEQLFEELGKHGQI